MEDLVKLERVHGSLSAMERRGLATGDQDSDRFLSNFFLFLVEPCGVLDLEKKCNLISQNLKKISSAMLEDLLHSKIDQGYQQTRSEPTSFKSKSARSRNTENLPKIGFDAMERANSTLEDFCRSYFMFHGMDANSPRAIFKYLPVLSFTESYIYQLDIINEERLCFSSEVARQSTAQVCDESSISSMQYLFDPLILLFERHKIITDRIRMELGSGCEYWALEWKLCHALKRNQEISIEDAMRAIHLKSFDYRVLNLLLYQLTGQEVNDLHMDFLSISELLVEISDDLYDYEDDVIDNSFNILRMFVAVYGPSAATMLAKFITEAEEKHKHLSRSLDAELWRKYMRRCEEATKEGGKISGYSLGTWTIPPIIVDEEAYRSQETRNRKKDLNFMVT